MLKKLETNEKINLKLGSNYLLYTLLQTFWSYNFFLKTKDCTIKCAICIMYDRVYVFFLVWYKIN